MSTTPATDLDTAIATLTDEQQGENAAVTALLDYVATVPSQIAGAIAIAQKTGATPAQLASIAALGDKITSDTAKMTAALLANPKP